MAGKRKRALQQIHAEREARRLRKQSRGKTPEPPSVQEPPRFSTPIPRLFITRPEEEGFEYLSVDVPGRHRVVFGFTSRETVNAFMEHEALDDRYKCSYIGYTEMRDWLESCQRANLHLVALDAASMTETFIRAAEIHEVIDILEHSVDDGDEIDAQFSMYFMIPTEPRGTDAQ